MKAVIYNTLNQKVLKEWQSIWEKSHFANYTNSPVWFISAQKAFPTKEYAIIAIYENEKLISAGGLAKVKKFGMDFYTLSPADYVSGIPFLIDSDNEEIMNLFMAKLKELGNVFFDNVPEAFLNKLQLHTRDITSIFETISLYLPVLKNEKKQVMIPKRSRMLNRIKGQEEKFEVKAFDGSTSKGLDIVFSIDDESSKKEKGYSTFECEEIRTFYSELANNFKEKFCINILYFNKKPIAYYIGFLVNKTYYWSQNAYISEYGQYSPGKVLLVKLIEHWGEKDADKIDFGSGDSRLKRELSNQYENLYQVVLSPNSFKRNYVKNVMTMKNNLYDQLHKRPKIYSLYRKVKTKV